MSQQLQEQVKEQMEFKLQVRYDRKPTTLIPTAQLIAKDLCVKVKDVGIIFETHKKAWLLDQIELAEDKIQSIILQETTAGAWVAFETTHDKDVDLQETFMEIDKASRNLKIMTYPLWFIIIIMGIIEGILIKKTLRDKELILLTKHHWTNIAWISVAVILGFILLFYYILKMTQNESYFRSSGMEYVSIETVVFYFETKNLFRQERTMRYEITLQVYRGRYYHPDKPEQIGFADDREPVITLNDLKQKIKITQDAIITFREQEYELSEDLDILKSEERELELTAVKRYLAAIKTIDNQPTQQTSKKNSQTTSKPVTKEELTKVITKEKLTKEDVPKDLYEKIIKEDEELTEQREQITKRQNALSVTREVVEKKRDELKKQLKTLQLQYYDAIKSSYQLDPKLKKDEQIDELINSHQKYLKYKVKVAELRSIILNMRQNIAGLSSVNTQMNESFEQRVAEESARRANTEYSYHIIAGSPEEMALSETSEGTARTSRRASSGGGFFSDRLFNILVILGAAAALITGFYFLAVKLYETFSEKPGIATFILILLIIFALALTKFANWLVNYTTHTTGHRLR
ncbi:MAG: hypothetical protein HZR80_21195 [Candidatus Heimdallarchaeota archaeon]